MIFAYTLDQVLRGEKWQTRRLIKPNEVLNHTKVVATVPSGKQRTVYQVGKTYAVQPGRGQKSVARILLTGIRREPIELLNSADALAEGFATREDFIDTWRTIHGTSFDLRTEVWVLEFVLHALVADELKTFYEQDRTNRRTNHGDDLPTSITRVSGIGLYIGNHPNG